MTPEAFSQDTTVMLVDDEPLIRNSSRRMLKLMGYEVILAENGRHALSIYKNRSERIGLVLLDLLMPEMSGEETFLELVKLNPEIKVLLVSGYSRDEMADELIAKGARGFIRKPFDIDEISDAIADALDS